jgi:hypothetical protein
LAEVVDPYLDPDTGLLRNLVGARTQDALDRAEGALVVSRAVQLHDHPVRATGDLDEFRAIHRQLFQDVYQWAGTTPDPTSALDRLALGTSRSNDFGVDAARLAGMDHPAAPVSKPPTAPRAPEAFGATGYRPGRDQGPDLGR